MKNRITVGQMTVAALVGGLYVVLCYFGDIFGLTYGPIQCRFAEALTVLPFLAPCTTWGLFVGCILANLLSPYGLPDLIIGSLATLLAGLWTARCPNKWLAPMPPVLCNGALVGALLAWYEVGFTAGFFGVFLYNGLTVALGELIACYGLGLPLLAATGRTGVLNRLSDYADKT